MEIYYSGKKMCEIILNPLFRVQKYWIFNLITPIKVGTHRKISKSKAV